MARSRFVSTILAGFCAAAASSATSEKADAGAGCCFSIGYGSMMKPCCLETHQVKKSSDCSVGQRMGGATGFSASGCPKDAEKASTLMKTGPLFPMEPGPVMITPAPSPAAKSKDAGRDLDALTLTDQQAEMPTAGVGQLAYFCAGLVAGVLLAVGVVVAVKRSGSRQDDRAASFLHSIE
eukprot:gnl/TRDRNA2_/TRDRNA2_67951_c0_seq1.p1 gnl/TRDRNA2_/TRDRNA2_67951_c0~~gnl/TRDRNA2_/TRDRNA2_67951_c0_seq1.p1  ORF type:complete len:180 (-),score=30.52 gnl/TRDRNA2_/TRDRNA2_67951_c0_seq1:100-639(-)